MIVNKQVVGLVWVVVSSLLSGSIFGQVGSRPDRVILSPAAKATEGVSVSWRTTAEVEKSYVEVGRCLPGPVVKDSPMRSIQSKVKKVAHTFNGEEVVFNAHSLLIEGLTPGELYMYRVGAEATGWSEWFQFRQPQSHKDSTLRFIYLGDPQTDLRSQWSRLIRQAYATCPEAAFILYAGDLVNKGYDDKEWADWFLAGGYIHSTVPGIMTPGNHEYQKVVLTPLWRAQFTLPENGPEGLEEVCYYIDYPDVRIISLDAEQIDETPRFLEAQRKWLDDLLTHTTQRWKIVTLHYPFYSTKPDRDFPELRKHFKPILDKHGVDLVLQGHDHGYGRGMVSPEGPEKPGKGPVYVVSVSGPKMYDVGPEGGWMQRAGGDLQLYQVIDIKGNKLVYKCYTARGELYDAFELHKKKGKFNQLVDQGHLYRTKK